MEAVIFMFCLTLHNAEEAIWLTDWTKKNLPGRRNPAKNAHFVFATIAVTALGYLAAGLFLLFPGNRCFEAIWIGFVGAMLINAVMPHLLLTIRFKKYCPGTFTGCFLIIPLHFIILRSAASSHLSIGEITLFTLVVGLSLLGAIPVFMGVAKKILDVE